mmetsp:Transcript_18463/g.16084  ORF Transcript_18463/g.16084 Transcript_18463/m.16084 type:complete len:108 (+) Transcript_18463:226-549(+)|eukprot:CAMPEP_0114577384 /NCGR_PEP_ID=MMETSP0125-20121206/2052_1 /TAXON_ID=485358 ORGANISM="Aristerostoma sp., Strain ATCC 50986" /NCGR_SAMPLE_ID=MMETSP0125 /ASSEMBLY_ACC=CAM_ASM_000245 /LENGTH=107 /DNA_ID=CAMNT_0001766657 /DNA_START=1081 /DNA_END=1407 /DNA_ORIENTATION=-
MKKTIEVSTYSQGEVFGEDEILLDKPRQYSVICDTTDGGELIAITKNDFYRKLYYDLTFRKHIANLAKQRQNYHTERIKQVLETYDNQKDLMLPYKFSPSKRIYTSN